MAVLRTRRLVLRHLTEGDAPFVLELVNDPDWLRHIGDKHVRTLADAVRYLRAGPLAMYERHGHGLYAVEVIATGTTVGVCGLVRRSGLEGVDLGFALLPAHRGLGYAYEAAAGTLEYARDVLGLRRVLAVTSPANVASAGLLTKLGMRREGKVALGGEAVDLFATPAEDAR